MESQLKQKLRAINYLALTTDTWTSCHMEAFLKVTVHYINREWNLNCNLLQCAEMPERHTADNISDRINVIMEYWEITNKVTAIVHDNAANMIAAMRHLTPQSVSCSAHCLQLAINKSLNDPDLETVISKASAIVTHFHHSTLAITELNKRQIQLQLPEVRLIKSVKTRWNSVLLMLERLIEQKNAVSAVLNANMAT